jgi:F0F1-type ATP synthase assembly protein I
VTDQDKWRHNLGDVAPYLSIGVQLAATMVVWVGIGWLVDRWQDTTPAFLIVGSVVGMIAFFVQLIRVSKELSARSNARGKKDDKAG